jgi:tetratricopeptide (TPR) repeat protein
MAKPIQRKQATPTTGESRSAEKQTSWFGDVPGTLTLKQELIVGAVILAITAVVFLPSLSNGFVFWDDHRYTYENPLLKDFSFVKIFSVSTSYMGNYHPLTLLWLHWETLLFPKGDANMYSGFDPFWFHLNNLFLHLLNTLLVFYVVYELLDRKEWKTAAVTALFFGIHPMHVESVAWISELKDVLYSAFFLGAAWLYIRYLRKKDFKLLAASFVLFIFSCLAKGQAVTLPLLLLLFDFYRGRKYDRLVLLEKLPFFAVSIIFGIIAIKAQASESFINQSYSLLSNLAYGFYGLMVYLWKFLLPINLSGCYPYPVEPLKPLPGYFYIIPVIIAAILFAFRITLKYSKDYLFGFLFFLLAISVTLRFIPLGDSIVADRYTYIPYIGLSFILGSLYSKGSAIAGWNKVAISLLVVVIVLLAALSLERSKIWKNSFTFWGNVAENYPGYWRSYNALGQEYAKAGNWALALENFNYACDQAKWAPPNPYLNRGALYVDHLNEYDKGIADFLKVLSFPDKNHPSQLDARKNLGLVYNKNGDFKNAVKILDEAIAMDPGQAVIHFLKGAALAGLGKFSEAENTYSKALSLDPGYADAWLKRGILYTDHMGAYDKGIADFRKVLELQPGDKNASVNLGICYFRKRMTEEALQIFTGEINADPGDGMLYYLRSLAYAGKNDFTQAYSDMVKARSLGVSISDQEMNDAAKKAKIHDSTTGRQ